MSYILDSLKKIEQEKIRNTGKADLKSLVVKADHSEKEVVDLKSTVRILLSIAASICILTAAGGTGYYFYHSEGKPEPIKPVHKDEVKSKPAPPARREEASKKKEPSTIAKAKPLPVVEKKPVKNPEPERKGVARKSRKRDDREVIKSSEGWLEKPNVPLPYESVLNQSRKEDVISQFPDFDIKGIIFFDEKDPDNYIILQDKNGQRRRLKTGNTYKNAEVADILPQKVRFFFQDNYIEKSMGE